MSELKVNKISPATGTAFTLGDSGDTFTVPSGATFTNSGTATGFGGGKILQVVHTNNVTASSQSVTTGTYTNITGLNATITPSATSSKIYISVNWCGESSRSDNHYDTFGIHRDTTILGPAAVGSRPRGLAPVSMGFNAANAATTKDSGNFTWVDSPSSTSSIVYHATYHVGSGASITLYTNRTVSDTDDGGNARTGSIITLMEIGA
jgi:hypothetical protein